MEGLVVILLLAVLLTRSLVVTCSQQSTKELFRILDAFVRVSGVSFIRRIVLYCIVFYGMADLITRESYAKFAQTSHGTLV